MIPFPSSGTLLILALTLFALILLAPFDYEATLWISQHNFEEFSHFFDRSWFEKEAFGASDFGVMIYIILLACFLTPKKWLQKSRLQPMKKFAPYLLGTGLATGVLLVHGLKNLTGRVRPLQVISENGKSFTEWYQFGPYLWPNDTFSGSLPSGHTATMLVFVSLGYLLMSSSKKWTRQVAWSLFLVGLILSVLMGISRSMRLQHWVSDWMISIGFGWGITHYLMCDVFRLHQRSLSNADGSANAKSQTLAHYRNFVLIYLILISSAFAIRQLVNQQIFSTTFLCIAGFSAILLFLFHCRCYRNVYQKGEDFQI